MINSLNRKWGWWLAVLVTVSACGGGNSRNTQDPSPTVTPTPTTTPTPTIAPPSEPLALVAHVGHEALSVGWQAPADDGGSPLLGYEVSTTPASAASDIHLSGTTALVGNVTNNTPYAIDVRAYNSAGFGPAASVEGLSAAAVSADQYQPLNIAGDDSVSGVFDPAPLHSASGELWLAYSSVHYYTNDAAQLVQDVGIRLARSSDGGASFQYQQTIATPSVATVTDTDPAFSACGSTTCTGRWAYETAWMIEDALDPDPQRRFKLFAHKYFLNPGGSPANFYHLGAIVMWTAAAPDATWSEEQVFLGWFLTPPELAPRHRLADVDDELAHCLVAGEGSAMVRGGSIDLVLTCPHVAGAEVLQDVVLLRSDDHLQGLHYVATLLRPNDALPLGADYYSAPALAASTSAPLLLVTPVFAGKYAGCQVFPIADIDTGQLFRLNGIPLSTQFFPTIGEHFGGACAYDSHGTASGVFISDVLSGETPVANQFRIYATGTELQRE